jgi:extradiol dioxygenase family protein
MSDRPIFHLAIPINDVAVAKAFYCEGLGTKAGRETEQALILDFFGHQVVAHTTELPLTPQKGIYPRHFGIVFDRESDWRSLCDRAKVKGIDFYIEPKLRFKGEITEHLSFFLEDPFHNLLEFKYYRHAEAIFGGEGFAAIGDR